MKFSENSLVVDVIKISDSSYKLSVPAGDLLTAAMNGTVLRRHDLSTAAVPNVLYVPLSEAKLSSGTYTFTFASGDAFTASSADAYPEASSVSDSELPTVGTNDKGKFLHTNESTGALEWATAGGSGGGGSNNVLIVHEDMDGNLDKTWQEIHDADFTIYSFTNEGSGEIVFGFVSGVTSEGNTYRVYVAFPSSGGATVSFDSLQYTTDSADGYPASTD